MKPHRSLLLFIGLFLILGCDQAPTRIASSTVVEAMALGSDDTFKRPMEPVEFVFPDDHGPHEEFRTEWWYYTGNLTDENGAEYGYQLTFFRSGLTPDVVSRSSEFATSDIFMAHFAVTDVQNNRHLSVERFARGGNQMAGAKGIPRYEVWLDGWFVRETGPDTYVLRAESSKDDSYFAVDLELKENRLLLHGDEGLSQKGSEPGNANYYYSLVRMESTGTITVGERQSAVSGLSWMDHEFGTSALTGDTTGWDWFSITLEDGTVLMFGEFHNEFGEGRDVYDGTLSFADGRQFSLGADDFTLEALETWTSPASQITYPAKWRVDIPDHDIQLNIEPLIPDQEMDVSFIYYEGATRIDASVQGQPVKGYGYVELTGYSGLSQYQR